MDNINSIYDEIEIEREQQEDVDETIIKTETDCFDEQSPYDDFVQVVNAKPFYTENKLNIRRLDKFKEKYSEIFIRMIKEQDFEYGIDTPSDDLIRKCMLENELATKDWLNSVYIANYDDVIIVTGVLRVISHIDYEDIAPQGPTMALAALVHKNSEVQECGIRALENWGTLECLRILKTVKCHEMWLQDYVKQVVFDLEEMWELNVLVG